jgi:hypothetical protein
LIDDTEIGIEVCRRQSHMENDRAKYDAQWSEIVERVIPTLDGFFARSQPGGKKTQKIFDATASLALNRAASAMENMVTPRTSRWHRCTVRDKELLKSATVKRFCDALTDVLFSQRYHGLANFASSKNEDYSSKMAFGPGVMYVGEVPGRHLIYRTIPLYECYFAENEYGIVDTLARKFEKSARQLAGEFGKDVLPDKMRQCLEPGKNPDENFEVIHLVVPNTDAVLGDLKSRWNFNSYYVSTAERKLLSKGGFGAFPYCVGRMYTNAGDPYGHGAAMIALPSIKALNAQKRDLIRQSNMIADPMILLGEDSLLQPFHVSPGKVARGYVTDDGKPRALPLITGARLEANYELIAQEQKTINDAFFITLFQILVDTPKATATEILVRQQEKGALLAPVMGREQEVLCAMIQREIELLSNNNVLPPMPPELIEAGGVVEIEYTSPLARAQKAEEGVAIMRTVENCGVFAQFDPSVVRRMNFGRALNRMNDINGAPADILNSDEEMAQAQAQADQAAQMQALLQAAPVAAQTAKTLMETQQLASQPTPAFTR